MLQKFQDQKRAAFIPFVVAGHPTLAASEKIIDTLVAEGADIIEIGVPFSDATADGPVIQAASEFTAKSIDSMLEVIEFAAKVKTRHPQIPLVLFTYFNPILQMGLENFAASCAKARIEATLVVDLPVDESHLFLKAMRAHQVKTVFLVSPTTDPKRVHEVAQASDAFVYYVSRLGVTGVQSQLAQNLGAQVKALRKLTPRGIAVGFGISTGAQATEVARMADGVVVGSAFVKRITEAKSPDLAVASVRELAREISQAIKSLGSTEDKR